MDILKVILVAFAGGMISSLVRWFNQGGPFQWRPFLNSAVRSLVSAATLATTFNYTVGVTPLSLVTAFTGTISVDALSGPVMAGTARLTQKIRCGIAWRKELKSKIETAKKMFWLTAAYFWFWYHTEFWIADKLKRRPFTYMMRDFSIQHKTATAIIIALDLVGLGFLVHYHPLAGFIVTAFYFMLAGHLWWGTEIIENQQEWPEYTGMKGRVRNG